MKATINGIEVEATPQELIEFLRIANKNNTICGVKPTAVTVATKKKYKKRKQKQSYRGMPVLRNRIKQYYEENPMRIVNIREVCNHVKAKQCGSVYKTIKKTMKFIGYEQEKGRHGLTIFMKNKT